MVNPSTRRPYPFEESVTDVRRPRTDALQEITNRRPNPFQDTNETKFPRLERATRPNPFDDTEPHKFLRPSTPDSLKREIEELAEQFFKRMRLDEVTAFLETHNISNDFYEQEVRLLQVKYPYFSEELIFQFFKTDFLSDKEFREYLRQNRIDGNDVDRMFQLWTGKDPRLEKADLYNMFKRHMANNLTQDFEILCPYRYSMKVAYFR